MCESHQRWGTFILNLGTLDLRVLESFAMYATDKRTDGRTDKSKSYCPLPMGGGIINRYSMMRMRESESDVTKCKHMTAVIQCDIFTVGHFPMSHYHTMSQ